MGTSSVVRYLEHTPVSAYKARFLNIAEGSVEACRYYSDSLANDLGLRPERPKVAPQRPGRSQPAPRRVRLRTISGFWLLTSSAPISRRDIKGEALG
jgi:hypothetical protein